MLFGLDMLKRHQAVIDLSTNCLRIHGEEVRFLSEHELPEKARWEGGGAPETDADAKKDGPQKPKEGPSPPKPPANPQPAKTASPAAAATPTPIGGGPSRPQYLEETIASLTNLGISRDEAIQALNAAGGNADIAAALLFQ